MRRGLRAVGILLFVAVFLCSGTVLFWKIYDQRQSEAAFRRIAELTRLPESSTSSKPAEDWAEPDFTATPAEVYAGAAAQNSDFIGWISIEGTEIDYPVMGSGETPDFYLTHSFDRTYSSRGVPYLAPDCAPGVSDNIVVYGHHMKDGSMFSALCEYKDPEFYEAHKLIRFDTLERFGQYEVIAAFTTVAYSEDGFPYYDFILAGDATAFDAYVSGCKELALYDTGLSAEYGDELLTLSTCEYSRPNGRMVVVAKRIS